MFIFFQHIAPQHLLSRFIGLFAASRKRGLKNFIINKFIARYGVNMHEALHTDAEDYLSFNDFFTRELKPGSRPIVEADNAIVCPADGVISACGNIEAGKLLQAKGKQFSLVNLLGGSSQRAQPFEEGNFATVYLSPKDYHRVHMPLSGTLKEMVFIPGKLFSVNQKTSENIPELFARNERVVCIFDTDIGPMAVILVGAMIVASIETVWAGQIAPSKQAMYATDFSEQHPPIQITKGDEVGRFKLGSTAIVLFGPGVMHWSENTQDNASVRMGEILGQTA
jgi:phosphatidylserine decarboxylase